MTKQQEKELNKKIKKTLEDTRLQGMRIGATGILGAVLEMCNEGKTVDDIKRFCETSLAMDGMKQE